MRLLQDASAFFGAPDLRILYLSRNAIRSLSGRRLTSGSLEELDLSHNAIANISGDSFGCTIVHVPCSNLDEARIVGELPKLTSLDLSHNPITDLPPRAFEVGLYH